VDEMDVKIDREPKSFYRRMYTVDSHKRLLLIIQESKNSFSALFPNILILLELDPLS